MGIKQSYRAIVIGGSAGSRDVLVKIIKQLPEDFSAGVVVVMHMHPHSDARDFAEYLNSKCRLPVCEAEEKWKLSSGHVYLAPANYHLLLELDGQFALDSGPKVLHSRPSIDVLFQSAAESFGKQLIGLLLSGASSDGAEGLASIKAAGGFTVVQDPCSAEYPLMPETAIARGEIDQILSADDLGSALVRLVMNEG